MANEDAVLEEAMDNLKEAGQRIRALAMTEAAYFEARRRSNL
jgi:hypothetical protein